MMNPKYLKASRLFDELTAELQGLEHEELANEGLGAHSDILFKLQRARDYAIDGKDAFLQAADFGQYRP